MLYLKYLFDTYRTFYPLLFIQNCATFNTNETKIDKTIYIQFFHPITHYTKYNYKIYIIFWFKHTEKHHSYYYETFAMTRQLILSNVNFSKSVIL